MLITLDMPPLFCARDHAIGQFRSSNAVQYAEGVWCAKRSDYKSMAAKAPPATSKPAAFRVAAPPVYGTGVVEEVGAALRDGQQVGYR